ncbi:hypothetical protein F4553_005386 [Allocatelliglobosispora scoriae]|uniref:DNA primase/polymerase bifunctional N-terminal domain-containing protein n=1 Tax=Allocatelliglobosispora scoriae TaxID=643052 RepID=A0A841BSG8_9ACTN|nr:bifunctional DNA primase/polymerase [Allocatelliglobosispora scoriae]MBB5872007.1 hypothetical protein [Allocatelliglobosispora scoriae]
MTHNLMGAAQAYIALGWPVFLLGRTKRPVALCHDCARARDSPDVVHDPESCPCLTCHGFYAATLDPKRLKRMFEAVPGGMLAIRTGAPSRLVVVDVDPAAGGGASLVSLIERGLCPPTRFVRTGSGGLHLYYRHPGPTVRVPCSAGVLGPGIDVRGDGGYIVAPPSIHPRTGRPYTCGTPGAQVEEMASPLLTAVTAPPRSTNLPDRAVPATAWTTSPAPGSGGIAHPERLMAVLVDRIHWAPHGRRRTILYGCARGGARIAATGAYTPRQAREVLLAACERAGWDINSGTLAAIDGGFRAEGVTG